MDVARDTYNFINGKHDISVVYLELTLEPSDKGFRMIRTILAVSLVASAASGQPALTVEPAECLVFDPLTVRVEGAPHGAMVQLRAEYAFSDEVMMRSQATFYADASGVVDVARDYATAGTYEGVEPHGLLWSAETDGDEEVAGRWAVMDGRDVTVTYTATVRHRLDSIETIELTESQVLSFQASNVASEKIAEGELRGVLYYPRDVDSPPTVLMMSGSDGGVYDSQAALFASRGFAVFAIASHNYEGRPEALMEIPLEYWRDGIDYLRERFDDDRVALHGFSRGGELALLIPSVWPERVDATVAVVPSNVVFPGCCTPEAFASVAFTLGGKPIERTNPPSIGEIVFDPKSTLPYSERMYYMMAMQEPEQYGGEIAVEKIDAPVMLVAGGADQMWPSDVASRMAAARLAENEFPYEVVLRIYPGAGHAAGSVVFNTTDSTDLGGTVRGNAHSIYDGHVQQIDFLRRHAKGGGEK